MTIQYQRIKAKLVDSALLDSSTIHYECLREKITSLTKRVIETRYVKQQITHTRYRDDDNTLIQQYFVD